MRRPVLVAILALLAVHLWLGFAFIQNSAPTYDEAVHLASGYTDLATGRYRLNVLDHPPFAEMWAAAAVLPRSPHLFLNHPAWLEGRVYHYADLFLYKNSTPADQLLDAARRFGFVTWTLLGMAVATLWAASAAGTAGAVGAALVYAFTPALLSNLALVTTDGASAILFFAACALAAWADERRSRGARARAQWLGAGAAAGLAMASKFNMVVLPPLLLGLAFATAFGDRNARRRVAEPWWLLAAALPVLAAVYRFGQAGLWWDGLTATFGRLQEGRGSFFMGRHSVTGTLWYFPAALAMKTPLAVLALAAIGLAAILRRPWRRAVWLWAPPAAYFAAALGARVQIGYRHVLPVVPFLVVWAGMGAAALWRRGAIGRAAAGALAAWMAVSVLLVHPRYLAYFNEAVGGPDRGYRYLVDSNLDWGQGLKDLARELARRGNPPVYLCYFGTADPEAYGIRYAPVGFIGNVERRGDAPDPSASGRVLFAISATNLQGTYYQDPEVFAWLRDRNPAALVGHSIFLYDLTGDADGRRRLAMVLPPAARAGVLALAAKK